MIDLRRPLGGPWGRRVVIAGCGYELVALHTALPTLSELVHRYRRSWPCRVIAGGIGAWLVHHLFIEQAAEIMEAVEEVLP